MVKKVTIHNALEPFLVKPGEKLHLASISRELNQPHPTVRQWLNALEKRGILTKENKGRLTLYYLNLQNPSLADYLVIAEKNKMISVCDKNPVLAEITQHNNENSAENTKALIFGSASESFTKAQDIDLLIIGRINMKNLKTFAKRLNKELHIITVSSLEKISLTLKKEIIKKHLLIRGSEDFVRWMVWQQ